MYVCGSRSDSRKNGVARFFFPSDKSVLAHNNQMNDFNFLRSERARRGELMNIITVISFQRTKSSEEIRRMVRLGWSRSSLVTVFTFSIVVSKRSRRVKSQSSDTGIFSLVKRVSIFVLLKHNWFICKEPENIMSLRFISWMLFSRL